MTTNTPIFPQVIQSYVQTYVNADGNTIKPVVTAGSSGTKINWITITNTDPMDGYDIQFYLNDGTNNYLLTTMNVLENSGNSDNYYPIVVFQPNNPSMYIFSPMPFLTFDSNGNYFMYLKAGWSLNAGIDPITTGFNQQSTVQGSYQVSILAQGEDF